MIPTRSSPGRSAAVNTADDAGRGERGGRVDGDDVGAGVLGEVQRGVQHPGHADVVDVVAVAEGERRSLVFRTRSTDRGRELRLERAAMGHCVDRVEDLHVAGAPAEMCPEVGLHGCLGERVALLVDLGLGPHDDARDAEPALQAAARRERVGEALPFGLVDALECGDRLAVDLGDVVLARHGGLAVDQHGAASALARWRAPVLRRGDVEFLAQRGEQMRMAVAHGDRRAVDLELDHLVDRAVECVGSGCVEDVRFDDVGHALQFVKPGGRAKPTLCDRRVNSPANPAFPDRVRKGGVGGQGWARGA